MTQQVKKIVILLLICLLIVLGTATIIEQLKDSEYVSTHIYHSIWFCILWGLIAVVLVVAMFGKKLWKSKSALFLHLSFLVILCGALTSFLTSRDGTLHLREGSSANYFYLNKTNNSSPLPFTLKLDSFCIINYPGTNAPSDYKSIVTYSKGGKGIEHRFTISMNNILDIDDYRIYQTSFDNDLHGTILTVRYDYWGTNITYLGYALFVISMLLLLLNKGSFRSLLHHPLLRKRIFFISLLFISGSFITVNARETVPSINKEKANELARQQIIYNDRTAPLNTLARDFLQKIYGNTTYHGLSAEQVLFGWGLRPEEWKNQPMILIKSAELREQLGIKGKYAKFSDLFNGNDYKLKDYAVNNEIKDQKVKKDVQELDEKVGLIIMLTQGTLVRPASGAAKVSASRIEAEIIYNAIPVTKILFMICLTLGFISFFILIYAMSKGNSQNINAIRKVYDVLGIFMIISFLLLFFAYTLRGIIIGRIPLSNGHETMLFMALFALLLGAVLQYRIRFAQPFAFLIAGFTLLVSHLGQMSPQITALMPVLNSPLLSSHVSIIMMAYSLFSFCMLSGIFALILMCKKKKNFRQNKSVLQLTIISRLLLYPAVLLLATGIFLGAIWANVSWGNYWSWDAKEVWALITLLIYSVPLHSQSLHSMRQPFRYHLYMTLAFLTVLMTFFGVNYILGGMHSYA